MTLYRVLRKLEHEDEKGTSTLWEEIDTYEAHDAQGAVSAAITASPDPAKMAVETFGATPASSWKELTPAGVEVSTRVKFA